MIKTLIGSSGLYKDGKCAILNGTLNNNNIEMQNEAYTTGFFWKSDSAISNLKILNESDFTRPIISDHSGIWNKCGLSDRSEIVDRNELVSFLFHNRNFEDRLYNDWGIRANKIGLLPGDGNDFLHFYEQNENAYWKLVNEFVSYVNVLPDCPKKLMSFVQILEKSLPLEEEEKEMSERISNSLKKATEIEGIIEFNLQDDYFGSIEAIVFGQKAYSAVWSNDFTASISDMFKNKFCNLIGLTKFVQNRAYKRAYTNSRRSALILEVPASLHEDIFDGVNSFIFSKDLFGEGSERVSPLTPSEKRRKRYLKNLPELKITTTFCYGKYGLSITPISIKLDSVSIDNIIDGMPKIKLHKGSYSDSERDQFNQMKELFVEELTETVAIQGASEITKFLGKHMGFQLGWSRNQNFKPNDRQTIQMGFPRKSLRRES